VFHINEKTRVFLRTGVTDLRLSFQGLRALVANVIKQDPLDAGYLFVFCNKARNRIKCLSWDGSGLVIWMKRLEPGHGTFDFPKNDTGAAEMNTAQLQLLLEGFELKSRRGWYRR
jgi:transposase